MTYLLDKAAVQHNFRILRNSI